MVEHILIVMVAAIGLTIFAERRGIPSPLLLAAVGLAASFIPDLPRTNLDPEVILGVVLPPLLYSAAVDFSVVSFMRRLRSILNLGVLLVVVTAVAGGLAVGRVLPVLSLPAALVLGAVVAPPDAVSALAIGGKAGLPTRLMTILKGESLINDAAALILFSTAVAAATGTDTFIGNPWLYFVYASLGGVAVGLGLGLAVHQIRRRLANPTLVTALAVLVPFAAYGLAREVSASGVVAVVFAGFALGHNAAQLGFAGRIQEREVWRVADALLESFVFAYMGLQLRFVIIDAERGGFQFADLLRAAVLLLAVVIVVRILWILLTGALARWNYRRWVARGRPLRRGRGLPEPLSWRENFVLSWTGMRGVVTLAAAAGTPFVNGNGSAFAVREAIIPIAFVVALGTLLLQGLTLPLLIRLLKLREIESPDLRRRQLAAAKETMQRAALSELERLRSRASPEEIETAERLLARARQSQQATDGNADAGMAGPRTRRSLEAAKGILAAQRRALIDERDAGRLEDEIMREALESIDLEEAAVFSRSERASAG